MKLKPEKKELKRIKSELIKGINKCKKSSDLVKLLENIAFAINLAEIQFYKEQLDKI